MITTAPTLNTWRVTDVLRPSGLTRLSGDPGAGKSLVALDLAASVASGTSWSGQKVTQGRALLVTSDPLATLRPRLQAWKRHHGVAEIPDLLFWPASIPVGGVHWDSFVSACQRIDPDLIVMDGPFWGWMFEGRENMTLPPQEARQVETVTELAVTLAGLENLARLTGAAVLVTHGSTDVPNADLTVTGNGSAVSVTVTARRGAAPFRFKVTSVPVGDGEPSVALTATS